MHTEPDSDDAVRIWHVPLDAPETWISRRLPWLDAAERQRAERFRFSSLRRRFLTAHVALRQILGGGSGYRA